MVAEPKSTLWSLKSHHNPGYLSLSWKVWIIVYNYELFLLEYLKSESMREKGCGIIHLDVEVFMLKMEC